jgi:hypothetical protein
MWIGMVTCVAASVGAGFAETVSGATACHQMWYMIKLILAQPVQLIITQGMLYGIGSGLLFAPSVSLVDEWFLYRRSLAYGI